MSLVYVCEVCADEFHPFKKTSRTCSSRCANTLRARETAAARGAKLRDNGEGKTYRKMRGRHEHRVVAEQKIGRALRPGEVVHHVNGDKRDNRPENLEVVVNQATHAAMHGTPCAPDCDCNRHHPERWRSHGRS